jgi:hypothetical protein
MSDVYRTLQKRYLGLIARRDTGETEEDFLEDVRSFIGDARRAGAAVADLNERSQLRAWVRFLATVLFDATGAHPDVTLQPLARGQLVTPRPGRTRAQAPLPPLGWALMGAAALIIIAGLLLVARWPLSQATPTPLLTLPLPAPVGNVVVGFGQDGTGSLALPADVFCAGTDEVVAQFTVPEPLPADARWGWRLVVDGRTVIDESSLTWETGSTGHTGPVALPDGSPFPPGHYQLTFLVDDRPVANRPFEVLAEEPRVTSLWISDVPTRTTRTEFEPGIRVIHAAYGLENLCPGLTVTRAVIFDGEVVDESFEAWSGTGDGSGELEYYQQGRLPLPSGAYEVVIAVGEGEPQRAAFTIAGAAPPAFGAITIARGVRPDGQPILPVQAGVPLWSTTKVVYAIFGHTGMDDGMAWSAVWKRDDEEDLRQYRWSAADAATEDTHWVAYYREDGDPLGGGDYTVELYIDGKLQGTAEFQIYYAAD